MLSALPLRGQKNTLPSSFDLKLSYGIGLASYFRRSVNIWEVAAIVNACFLTHYNAAIGGIYAYQNQTSILQSTLIEEDNTSHSFGYVTYVNRHVWKNLIAHIEYGALHYQNIASTQRQWIHRLAPSIGAFQAIGQKGGIQLNLFFNALYGLNKNYGSALSLRLSLLF